MYTKEKNSGKRIFHKPKVQIISVKKQLDRWTKHKNLAKVSGFFVSAEWRFFIKQNVWEIKDCDLYLIDKKHGSRILQQTIWLWNHTHTSHKKIYFYEFVANFLRDNMGMIIFLPPRLWMLLKVKKIISSENLKSINSYDCNLFLSENWM